MNQLKKKVKVYRHNLCAIFYVKVNSSPIAIVIKLRQSV